MAVFGIVFGSKICKAKTVQAFDLLEIPVCTMARTQLCCPNETNQKSSGRGIYSKVSESQIAKPAPASASQHRQT